MGKFVATKVANYKIVANNPTIELIHVFTHAGDKPSEECDVGIFSNRGGYYSPFSHSLYYVSILVKSYQLTYYVAES